MYIRTKDGVYKVVDTYETKYVVGYTEDGFEISIYKENVISQSENLEELCDEFVLIEPRDDGGKKYSHRDKESFIRDYIGYEHIDIVLSYYTIYGAIWTDKGLIYVAKMNEKGELELI